MREGEDCGWREGGREGYQSKLPLITNVSSIPPVRSLNRITSPLSLSPKALSMCGCVVCMCVCVSMCVSQRAD